MKKTLSLIGILFLLNGCAESMALLGPAASGLGSGNAIQSTVTSAASYGIKRQTGKSPAGHALSYIKKNNPNKKREKCVSLLESTNTEVCKAVKNNIIQAKKK